jgi:hypothetical protein
MNRDETIKLFERCEAARAAAKKAALDEGKPEHEARGIAHEAAKVVWNGWAEPLLAERKRLEEDRRWAATENDLGILEPQNDDTRDWMARAEADFSRCHFLVRGNEGTAVTAGAVKNESGAPKQPVKKLYLDDARTEFSGARSPALASL